MAGRVYASLRCSRGLASPRHRRCDTSQSTTFRLAGRTMKCCGPMASMRKASRQAWPRASAKVIDHGRANLRQFRRADAESACRGGVAAAEKGSRQAARGPSARWKSALELEGERDLRRSRQPSLSGVDRAGRADHCQAALVLAGAHSIGRAFNLPVRHVRHYALVRRILRDNTEAFRIAKRLFRFADDM